MVSCSCLIILRWTRTMHCSFADLATLVFPTQAWATQKYRWLSSVSQQTFQITKTMIESSLIPNRSLSNRSSPKSKLLYVLFLVYNLAVSIFGLSFYQAREIDELNCKIKTYVPCCLLLEFIQAFFFPFVFVIKLTPPTRFLWSLINFFKNLNISIKSISLCLRNCICTYYW